MTIRTRHGGVIVVGVDESLGSDAALHVGARLARAMDCALRIVRVRHEPLREEETPEGWAELPAEPSARDDERAARRSAEAEFHGEPPDWVHVEVLTGEPARTLVGASATARFLVVGSHAHAGLSGLRLGSVSATCATHALCPVVVVPPNAAAARSSHASTTPERPERVRPVPTTTGGGAP